MIFKRFYDDNLAQASYLLADEHTREAFVVDPTADIALYQRAAGADRLRIVHVAETHVHADFVSGGAALAEAAGATLHLSAASDSPWSYSAEALQRAHGLVDGSVISFGQIRLRAAHTPGHTPEHLIFFVSDLDRGDGAVGALTGDFLFVGDVGRPDLLERAAGAAGTMQQAAADLFQSLQKLKAEPDYLQIWPGHGAGSACGKSLGAMPQSSLGYEKLFNWALADIEKQEFVARVLRDQPVPPAYFAVMKRINRTAQPLVGASEIRRSSLTDLEKALRRGDAVIDTRPTAHFAKEHIPGTLNIPYNKSFLNWCGALVPADRAVFLLTDGEGDEPATAIVSDLRKIGFTEIAGFSGMGILKEWKGGLENVSQLAADELRSRADDGGVQIVDVRNPDEWSRGHIPGAVHIPLAALPGRLGEIDQSRPVVLHCQGGGRSSIAAGFLLANGIGNVANLTGGYEEWASRGFAVEQDGEEAPQAARQKA